MIRRPLPAWVNNLALTILIAALWPINSRLENRLNPYFFTILIAIGINITLATSLNLINGITGQFSLGHAGFMAIGAYAAGSLMKHLAPVGPALWPTYLGVLGL